MLALLYEDYVALKTLINDLKKEYEGWGKKAMSDVSVGDWHDNFTYEEGMRQMNMIGKRIEDLNRLIENSIIVRYEEIKKQNEFVALGSKVVVEVNGKIQKYFIAGHAVFRKDNNFEGYTVIASTSPLGTHLVDNCIDDELNFELGKKQVNLKILIIN